MGIRHSTGVRCSRRSDGLLLVAAAIWGFAFVAQRMGMEHVGPFTFNGIRFALGATVLLPIVWWFGRSHRPKPGKNILGGGLAAGLLLFMGASLQQIGLVTTTAGNAGFITGLYIILVPLFGLFLGARTRPGTAAGAVLAFTGLYLLSVRDGFHMASGDFLVFIGAFFWAGHVQLIGRLARRTDTLKLAVVQFSVCAMLSMGFAIALETVTVEGIRAAAIPILYGGLISVGIAYTLQIAGQKGARPSHAAIILSLEAVFAALGGWLILGESLTPRSLAGAALMLAGMVISQVWLRTKGSAGKMHNI